MNWEAIGAIGEIIGAISVLATLIFLSSQLRQNTMSFSNKVREVQHLLSSKSLLP